MKLQTGIRRSIVSKVDDLKKIKGRCYFCHKEIDGESYCFGCQKFVCGSCDRDGRSGEHTIEEHLVALWE